MTLVILIALIALIPVSAIAVARDVSRDGHGRRPRTAEYDSRRPAP